MRRIQTFAEGHHNHERWLLTYADMITLLTAFFLMLYSMSVMSRGKFSMLATSVRSGFGDVAPGGQGILSNARSNTGSPESNGYRAYQESVSNLRRYVEQQKQSGQVSIRASDRGMVISLLSDGLLFDRGQSDLKPASVGLLSRVAKILRVAPNAIEVQGHTCDLPIHTVVFPSNWELSTARAGTILRFFTDQSAIDARRFTIAGYADTRGLAPNDSEQNRARNRRVDIILLKTDAQRQAEWKRQEEVRRISQPLPASPTPDANRSNSTESTPGTQADSGQQTTSEVKPEVKSEVKQDTIQEKKTNQKTKQADNAERKQDAAPRSPERAVDTGNGGATMEP